MQGGSTRLVLFGPGLEVCRKSAPQHRGLQTTLGATFEGGREVEAQGCLQGCHPALVLTIIQGRVFVAQLEVQGSQGHG